MFIQKFILISEKDTLPTIPTLQEQTGYIGLPIYFVQNMNHIKIWLFLTIFMPCVVSNLKSKSTKMLKHIFLWLQYLWLLILSKIIGKIIYKHLTDIKFNFNWLYCLLIKLGF